ncbi:putative Ankyrin repeat-containing protein [Sulfurovum sp. enrichment culture clone C5]|uniref:Putative Ankyrin repeat-containing protein n=1 Tax=Sulfurovum sp. enrichment culture clone C5 TaxID=497650 RepID=A0A0S4XQL8_9BACT|nr:putative Ankyrin repeat-containing protein [Sulfurovum sp. enrichment culture clone C5]
MKKWLIGIAIFFGVIIIVKQLNHNDYSSAQQFAKKGNYQEFYNQIKGGIDKDDDNAQDIYAKTLCEAIAQNDINSVEFLISKNDSIINYDKTGDLRPLTCLFAYSYKNIDIAMLKKILSYHPDLNYEIKQWRNLTPLQAISMNSKINNNLAVVQLLIENGADVNYYKHDESDSSVAPLLGFYTKDNFQGFKLLLKNKAILPDSKKFDLLTNIASDYSLFLMKNLGKNYKLYKMPLSQNQKLILDAKKFNDLHNKNMRYLKELDSSNLLTYNDYSKRGLYHLALVFTSLDLRDGMDLLIKNGVCSQDKKRCLNMIKKANEMGNTEIANQLEKEI